MLGAERMRVNYKSQAQMKEHVRFSIDSSLFFSSKGG